MCNGLLYVPKGVGDGATSEARALPLLTSSSQENQSLDEYNPVRNRIISVVKHWFLQSVTA